MQNTKKIVLVFLVLFCIVFFAILISLMSGNKVEFTNLPIQGSDTPSVERHDPAYGNNEPSVLIYHFGDFSNQTSADIAEILQKITSETPEVAIVWKDFPNISLNSEAWNAAIAARCAQKQDAFWEYHDYLSTYPNQLSNELYKNIAAELDLWQWSFERCLEKEKTDEWVLESMEQASGLSLTAAPTIYINGESYTGIMSESEIESIINSILLAM